jgi:hypothetical protein
MLLLLLLPPPTATAGVQGVFGLLLVVLLGLVGLLLPGNPIIPNGLMGTSNDFWYASRLPYAMIPVYRETQTRRKRDKENSLKINQKQKSENAQ